MVSPRNSTAPLPISKKKITTASLDVNKLNISTLPSNLDENTRCEKRKDEIKRNVSLNSSNAINISAVLQTNPTVQVNKLSNDNTKNNQSEKYNEVDFNEQRSNVRDTANRQTSSKNDFNKPKLCQNCDIHHHENSCPLEFPLYIIADSVDRNEWIKKYSTLHEKQHDIDKYNYSFTSLPACLSISFIKKSEARVLAKIDLESFSQFGPLVGRMVEEKDISENIDLKYIWELNESSGTSYLNTENSSVSNWLKYIRPARNLEDKNVTVLCKDKKLYFITVKHIKANEELLYWVCNDSLSGKKKAEKTGIY